MRRGINQEPVLLDNFNTAHNTCCASTVIEYVKDSRIFASLDGYDPFINTGLEIKTTSKTIDKFADIYQYYKYQLAHQMYCSGLNEIWLSIEYANNIKQDYLIQLSEIGLSESEWYNLCCEYLTMLNGSNQPGLLELFNQHESLNKIINEQKAKLDEIKAQIQEAMPSGGVCSNYTLTRSERNSISYASFVKDNKLEIPDTYKTTSISYRITNKEKTDDQ
jgi:hypothetical protein